MNQEFGLISIEERFAQGDSPLHAAAPRVKLAATAVLVLTLALCNQFATATAGVALGLTLVALARLPWRTVQTSLLGVLGFLVFLWLALPLTAPTTNPGDALFTLWSLKISRQGVQLAALISLKSIGIFLCFITLAATSPLPALGHALSRLKLPDKLCWLLLFTYRYVFIIADEYSRLQRAAALRCFKPRTNLRTYRTYASLFGMTLVRSWNRAERVGQAMTLRGFSGRFHPLHAKPLTGRDYAMGAALLLIAACLIWLDMAGYKLVNAALLA